MNSAQGISPYPGHFEQIAEMMEKSGERKGEKKRKNGKKA